MLILASASSIRSAMLSSVGLVHEIMPPEGFDEDALKASLEGTPPAQKAVLLAKGKAAYVSALRPEALVLAADQICAMGDVIFSKPKTPERAAEQLTQLRGKTHHQYSAVTLYQDGKCLWEHVETASLTMRNLTDSEIHAYIALDNPLASCGAYMFEKMGKHLFERVQGTDDVIQGMPLVALLNALYALGKVSLVTQ
jgi:septum formation protein